MAGHHPLSQFALILRHLKENGCITPMEALSNYGVYRLGAIIFLIKDEGYNITSEMVTYTKPSGRHGRYAKYRLGKAHGI